MSNNKKFFITIVIGLVAIFLTFGLQQEKLAYMLVAIAGGIVSLSMLMEMVKTLREGKYGVDILAITAIIATLAVGDYWASLMILIMLTGGESLEDYASKQASRELRSLLDKTPQLAHRTNGNQIEDIEVDDLHIGNSVLVKPNEMVPVDGVISKGESDFDESSLTGESKPIEKKIGDQLLSGSINGTNAIYFTVSALAKDSQYQQLVQLVKESSDNPAPFVRLADKYSVPFTILAYLIGGLAWFISKDPVRFAQVLVVASPCPLILAAPVALVAGMSQSSKNGIIIKTGTSIEKLAQAKTVAFDKTGTITQGNLIVDQIFTNHIPETDLLTYAASLEQASSHILARSIVSYTKKQNLKIIEMENVQEITAQGVTGRYDNHQYAAGKISLIEDESHLTESQQTTVYIAKDGQYLGHITFKDAIRPESKETMTRLKSSGIEHLVMLTGDKKEIAKEIAAQVGISEYHAECLPQDKINFLKSVSKDNRPVIMVGDGVNDAPALASADIGIAMGAHGSTAASESADAVILKDDLSKVATVVTISKHTMTIAKQSVLIGLIVCVVLMLIAFTGIIPTLIGAILQELVDTVSILSALRAKNKPKKNHKKDLGKSFL